MEELGEQDAFCVDVGPGDEDAHGGHSGGESEKEGEPVGAVGRGGSQVVDDGDMPGAPEQAEQDGGSQGIAWAAHFWEGVAHPADFLEESGGKTKCDADEKAVGGKDWRDEGFHGEKNGQDYRGWDEECGVPACGEAHAAHREKRSRRPLVPSTIRVNTMPTTLGPRSMTGNIMRPANFGMASPRRRCGAATLNAPSQETVKVRTK